MKKDHIIISGGGFVGLSLAIGLAKMGVKSTIIEKRKDLVLNDQRTIVLSALSMQFLKDLGVQIDKNMQDISDILVSRDTFSSFIHYKKNDKPMGHLLYNKDLYAELVKVAKKYGDKINVKNDDMIISVKKSQSNVEILTARNQTVEGSLVIAADGTHSSMRELANLSFINKKYKQKAMFFEIEHQNAHNGFAFEHFMPQGPLAILPLKHPNQSYVIFSTTKADDYVKMGDRKLAVNLQEMVGQFTGQIKLLQDPCVLPLQLSFSVNLVSKDKILLIGDAAHSIHPVAGQGLNLGLKDIMVFLDLANEQLNRGLDLGAYGFLKKYSRRRKADSVSMIYATHLLVKAFSQQSITLSFLLSYGMDAVEGNPAAKKMFVNYATGEKMQDLIKRLKSSYN